VAVPPLLLLTGFSPRALCGASLGRMFASESQDVLVDFNGVLMKIGGGVVDGAREAMAAIRAAGLRVLIWSAASSESMKAGNEIASWLKDHDIEYDEVYVGPKPKARAYIDDHAIEFKDNWPAIVRRLTTSNRPELHVLIGLPGSGKSSFAADSGFVVVSHDRMRAQLDGTHATATAWERRAVWAALAAGENVVLDRLNLTRAHRQRWIELARACGAKPVAVHFNLGGDMPWLGNLDRQVAKRVGLRKFVVQLSEFELPSIDEGYAAVYQVGRDRQLKRVA